MPTLSSTAVIQDLQSIFAEVLEQQDFTLTRNSTADDVPGWDSLAHLEIIEVVQRRYKIKFSLTDLEQLHNAGDLADLVLAKTQ